MAMVTTRTYSVPMPLPRFDEPPWLPGDDPKDYSPDFFFQGMGHVFIDGIGQDLRPAVDDNTTPGDLSTPNAGAPAVMHYRAYAERLISEYGDVIIPHGIWSTTRQATALALPVRGNGVVGFRTYLDVEARVAGWGGAPLPTLSAEVTVDAYGGTSAPRPYLTGEWATYPLPIWQFAASDYQMENLGYLYDALAIQLSVGAVTTHVNADVRPEEYAGWGSIELGWVSLRVEVDIAADETPAYRRTYPRHDSLAGGAGRNYPPSRAIQTSNRIGGGYL